MVYKTVKRYIKRHNSKGGAKRKSYSGSQESEQLTDTSGSSAELQQERPSLLERVGGAEALNSVVELFYELVFCDALLMDFFQGADLHVLSIHQKRFLSMAFTKIPQGISVERMIKSHHQRLFADGLSEIHFDRVAQHLISAMKAHNLTDDQVKEAVDIVAPLRQIFEDGAKEAQRSRTQSPTSTILIEGSVSE